MGIISKLLNNTKYVTVIGTDFHLPDSVNADFDINADTISTLLTCQKVLAESVSKLPVEVMQSSAELGKVKFKDHSVYRTIHNRPNNYQTSTQFFQTIEFHRAKYGNAFAKIYRIAGKVDTLEIIHPKQIVGYKIAAGKLYYYRVDGDGKDEVINADNLLHFRFLSDDGIFGLNPSQVLYRELENIFQGKQTLNHAYKNQLGIDKVIESGVSNFSAQGVQKSIDALKAEYSGAVNRGKVPVLPAGFKITPIASASIQDAQILQSINFSKKDIAALYGVPPHLVGVDGGISYNSIEQHTINFKVNTLQPIARMYRQEMESKLLSDAEIDAGVSIEFNLNAMVEVDMNTRISYLKTLHSMAVVSSNDVARIEGFEVYEGGEKHFIQSQYIPIEQYNEFAKVQQGKPSPEEEKTNENYEGKEDIK